MQTPTITAYGFLQVRYDESRNLIFVIRDDVIGIITKVKLSTPDINEEIEIGKNSRVLLALDSAATSASNF